MLKEYRNNIKKITAMLLVASMVMGGNVTLCAQNALAEEAETIEVVEATEDAETTEEIEAAGKPEAAVEADSDFNSTSESIEVEDKNATEEIETVDGAETPEAEATVTIANSLLVSCLQKTYGDKFVTDAGVISKNAIDQITSLQVSGSDFGDLSDLEKFEKLKYLEISNVGNITKIKFPSNLKDLVIESVANIHNEGYLINGKEEIEFPNTLKSLYVNNSSFNCHVDISKCTELTELIFTENKLYLQDADKYIIGLNGNSVGTSLLGKLKQAAFDGTDLTELRFPNSVSSTGLEFSAQYCDEMAVLTFGDYTLVGDTKLKGCTALASLNDDAPVNGHVGAQSQTLDLSNCSRLGTIVLNYSFDSNVNNNYLNVDTRGITLNDEVNKFSIESGEKKYNLYVMKDSYVHDDCSNDDNKSYIKNIYVSSPTPKFIIFKCEKEKFEKQQLWREDKSTYRRDYFSNPIVLRKDQKYDNTAYLYSEDGILLGEAPYVKEGSPDKNYETITLGVLDGKNEDDVISINDGNATTPPTITAKNPGNVVLKFTYSKGDLSITVEQDIFVYNLIKSIEFNNNNETVLVGNPQNYINDVTEYTINSTIKLETVKRCKEKHDNKSVSYKQIADTEPSLISEITEANKTWEADNLDSFNATNSGISVYNGNVLKYDNNCTEIERGLALAFKSSAKSGNYKMRTYSANNYKNGVTYYASEADQIANRLYSSNDYEFTIINIRQTDNELGYEYTDYNGNEHKPSASINLIFDEFDDYYLDDMVIRNPEKYGDYITFSNDGKRGEYTLSINEIAHTRKEVEAFFDSLPENDRKLDIEATVKNDAKSFEKTIVSKIWIGKLIKPEEEPVSDDTPKSYSVTVADGIKIEVAVKDKNGNTLPLPADTDLSSKVKVTAKKVTFAKAKEMPVIEGYTFKGWYKEGSKKKVSSVSKKKFTTLADAKINAVYTENTYSIAFKKTKPEKGAKLTGKIKNLTKLEYTKEVTIPTNELTATKKGNEKKGIAEKNYKLAGWTDVKGGTEVKYTPGQVVSKLAGANKKNKKITLYSVWK